TPTLTGTIAATRLPVDASRLPGLVTSLAAELGGTAAQATQLSDEERAWLKLALRDLRDHQGRSVLAVSADLPPAVHAKAAILKERLGNVGQTLWYGEPLARVASDVGTLGDLVRDIEAGTVEALITIDANPAYAAPAFTKLIPRIRQTIHAGVYQDETAVLSNWHVPLAHALESWGDARAVDGTTTILQPLVAPFYSVRTVHQVMEMLLGAIDPAADAPVHATWQQTFAGDFDRRWV